MTTHTCENPDRVNPDFEILEVDDTEVDALVGLVIEDIVLAVLEASLHQYQII